MKKWILALAFLLTTSLAFGADNITVTEGAGKVIASDEVAAVNYQLVKLVDSTDDSTDRIGIAAKPLQVSLANTAANATPVVVDLGTNNDVTITGTATVDLGVNNDVTVTNATAANCKVEATIAAAQTLAAVTSITNAVTANLSATDNAVLDTIDTVLDTINAKLVTGTVIGDVNLGATDNAVLDTIAAKDFATQTTLAAVNAKLVTGTVIGDVNLGATDNAVLDAMVVDLAALEVLAGTIDADTGAMVIDLAAIEIDVAALEVDLAAIEVLATSIDADTNDIKTAVQLIDNTVGAIAGPGSPVIDSYTHLAINLAAGADQVLVSSAANKQIWVYGVTFTTNVAGTVSFQDELDAAISGIMQIDAKGGMAVAPSGNFAMPLWKLGTDKDLEVDVVTAELDGFLTYSLVSV